MGSARAAHGSPGATECHFCTADIDFNPCLFQWGVQRSSIPLPSLGVGAQARTSALVLPAVGDAGFWELFPAICKLLNQLRNGCPRLTGSCLSGIGSDEPSGLKKSVSALADLSKCCRRSLLSPAPASEVRQQNLSMVRIPFRHLFACQAFRFPSQAHGPAGKSPVSVGPGEEPRAVHGTARARVAPNCSRQYLSSAQRSN